jgi:hypothetical protein
MTIKRPEKKVRVYNKKKITFKSAVSIMVFLMALFMIYGLYSFFTTYGLRTPVIFQSPVYRLNPEVIISPISTPSGKTTSVTIDLGKIADKIYTLESSGGKNDGCRKLGLYNGYGYRQNTSEWVCYGSHEEVRQHVISWLTENIKNGDVQDALCYYNKGKRNIGCTYAVNYKSL